MFQVVCIALIFAILILYLKSINSEYAILTTIGAGVVLIGYSLKYIVNTFEFFNLFIELSGIDKELYMIIFKVVSVGYLVEFGASTIQDFGLKNLADKLTFIGKLIILSLSFPIVYAVFNLLQGLIA